MIKRKIRDLIRRSRGTKYRDYAMAPFITSNRSSKSSFKHRQKEEEEEEEDTEVGIVVFSLRWNKIRFRFNKYCFVALLLKLTPLPTLRSTVYAAVEQEAIRTRRGGDNLNR